MVEKLAGAVVNESVGGFVGLDPTSFGNFFRFARVTEAVHVPEGSNCQQCEDPAHSRRAIEWGAGYEDDDGGPVRELRCGFGHRRRAGRCIRGGITFGRRPFGHYVDRSEEIETTTTNRRVAI